MTVHEELVRQNERLRLLLCLTNKITSNLDLREVVRSISGNIREVLLGDLVCISVVDAEPGMIRVYALDFPGSPGIVKEGMLVALTPSGKALFQTPQPMLASTTNPETFPVDLPEQVAFAEEPKTVCFIPLVNRGRPVGLLAVGRTAQLPYASDEMELLSQVAGQIAIAIDNARAYQEISELRDRLAQEKVYLEEEIRSEMGFEQIIGSSDALKQVLQLVETVAPSDSTVLLLGETGTGKELIARAIHDRSRRRERTFVKLNCAAIPTGLLESELFGHEKGAFTGAISQKAGRMELADQGTLFLDEVGDIPVEIQPKLLRALQEREFERLGSTSTRRVNIRLVAATNRDLEEMVASREFRSDLYYRLNVFPIRIPPLRERKEDIPLLVGYFVQKFAKLMQKRIDAIPAVTMKGLAAWDWPGNIRELENFIERAVILTRGKALEAPLSELRRSKQSEPAQAAATTTSEADIARIVKETIASINGAAPGNGHAKRQRDEIVQALMDCKGRVGGADGAAVRLGIGRTTLISRMKKLGINPYDYV
ncbi:MAG: sigma 54-interacting transcriptional regulator [Terracidiphilus sp.]